MADPLQSIEKKTADVKASVDAKAAFSEEEVKNAVASLGNLGLSDKFLEGYKAWVIKHATGGLGIPDMQAGAADLRKLISEDGGAASVEDFFLRHFEHAMTGWISAAAHKHERNFAVVVNGVNGIRKSTAMYMTWFPEMLHATLSASPTFAERGIKAEELPTALNSFFRQLDFFFATVCNEELFTVLNTLSEVSTPDAASLKKLVDVYVGAKTELFKRYRVTSEKWMHLIVELAAEKKMNVVFEATGGNLTYNNVDIPGHPMAEHYEYVNLHFDVNEMKYSEESIYCRMQSELNRMKLMSIRQMMDKRERAKETIRAIEGGVGYAPKPGDLNKLQALSHAHWLAVSAGEGDAAKMDMVRAKKVNETWLNGAIHVKGDPDITNWTVAPVIGRERNGDEIKEIEGPARGFGEKK